MTEPPFSYVQFAASAETPAVAFSFYAKGRIAHRTDKILPTGFVMILHTFGGPHRLGADPTPERNPAFNQSWVQGNWTRPLYHTPMDGTHVIGLALPPQSLMRLTGAPTKTLTDRVVPAADFLPKKLCTALKAMRPQAAQTDAHQSLHRLIQTNAQHPVPDWVDQLHDTIATAQGQVTFPGLYRGLPVSGRTAREGFKTAIGLTPRHCARIQRLMALLDAVDPAGRVNWTALAHTYGFFDQPHFNNEFRKLTGLSPSRYLADRRRAWPDATQGEHVSFTPEGLP